MAAKGMCEVAHEEPWLIEAKEMGMKRTIRLALVTVAVTLGAMNTMAVEEAPYKVVKKDNRFEIRDYAAHVLAETIVEGDLEDAGNNAFYRLFNYISGNNRSRTKVAMTAPVSQQSVGEKIAMTAPVEQRRANANWAVSFTMPDSYTLESLPVPEDPTVTLRQVPARRMAVVRYSGFWSEKRYLKFKTQLEAWISEMGLTTAGDPVWARYNPPFTPWFLRRNEILIPVNADNM